MNRQVRTTVVFGLISALILFPITIAVGETFGLYGSFELTLWFIFATYAVLLVRWSKTPLLPVLFPLGILLLSALLLPFRAGFYWLALLTLGWIRSGICFKGPSLRLLFAETVAMAGGVALVAVWQPASPVSMSLTLWLFFLIQSLYFFVLPGGSQADSGNAARDPFEAALRAAKEIVG